MRFVLLFLLVLPIAATAGRTGGEPISKIAESYKTDPRETMKEFSRFIDGFRFGYLAMYRRQKMFAAEKGLELSLDDADSDFMSCMLSNDPDSAMLYRLLGDAMKYPDNQLFLWVTDDFAEQCGEEMKAAIADQYTTQ